ncbi:hypothetical protein [Ramlibacter rhizophilus]|uniref:Uncharacterized protein n=1 Tax=Ramlibacter rhizophilus TaxID=1781167 RepID=A0A4Z0BX85_9BURK|nr:hypothetical protein [Ramlibacter rhizophilus]TFZ03312.1 hypothetical protein EZ242_05345 [Ramlibacter rhizophilus]
METLRVVAAFSRLRWALALLLGMSLGLAGCGGGDDGDSVLGAVGLQRSAPADAAADPALPPQRPPRR